MKDDDWNLFCQTGMIEDYLHYACTNEDLAAANEFDERSGEDAGKSNRHSFTFVSDGRI